MPPVLRVLILASLLGLSAAGQTTAQERTLAGWNPVSPALADADYDGRTDEQELADGTDPHDPSSVRWVRLGYWRFDQPTGADAVGTRPLQMEQVTWATEAGFPSATLVGATGRARIIYPEADANGHPTVNLRNGSIRLLYQPLWASRDPMAAPGFSWGGGPGHWARLFEAGSSEAGSPSGLFALSIDPTGTRLVFQTRDAQGNGQTNFQVQISWTYYRPAPGQGPGPSWHEILLLYTPTYCQMVVDGALKQDAVSKFWVGAGVVGYPPAAARAKGFAVGSSTAGDLPAEGGVAELETFNYPITPLHTYANLESTWMNATVSDAALPTVTLHWLSTRAAPQTVQRRSSAGGPWEVLATNVLADSYQDRSSRLQMGQTFEYEVGPRVMLVGLRAEPVEARGRVILLVDRTQVSKLSSALQQLRMDLVEDGWEVIEHSVPRHDDQAWSARPVNPNYRADVIGVKSLILADYAADPKRTKAVFLIGHVTIPYSGAANEDGHPDHYGAWPADAFYGDIDGRWSDGMVDTANAVANPVFRNWPGDGKWDPALFGQFMVSSNQAGESGVELAVGRIDFAKLPSFRAQSETDLLRQYLNKDHRYRSKQITFNRGGVVAGYFYGAFNADSRPPYDNAAWLLSRLLGGGPEGIEDGDCFAARDSYLWGMQGGYGANNRINNSPQCNRDLGIQAHATEDLAGARPEPRIGFYLLKGSYFCDWNLDQDNLLRATLGTPNYGLASLCALTGIWRFESAALGDTLGSAFVRTARNGASTRTTFLLGDPTLRLFVTAPPVGLTAHRSGAAVVLTWKPSAERDTSYFVYRSIRGTAGPYERLNDRALAELTLADSAPPAGPKTYLVRAANLITCGSGSFTNLSQGIVVSVAQ